MSEGNYNTRFHMCISVRGVIQKSDAELRRDHMKWINKDDGTPFRTPGELRSAFMDELSQGHEVVPFGECDNFDWKKGCQGHPITKETPCPTKP